METLALLLSLATGLSAYALWFYFLSGKLTGPRVYPFIGSLPILIKNRKILHDWTMSNLRATGDSATFQTTIIALSYLANKQGFYTVTCHPKDIKHILRTQFENYSKGPTWQMAFHDLLGQGNFNTDGETWLIERKTAARVHNKNVKASHGSVGEQDDQELFHFGSSC